ncbi:MAG TPA: hypothetical protein VGC07_07515 [Granulicella sp.]
MRPKTGDWENLFSLSASAVALLLSALTFALRGHIHIPYTRLQYGFEHLPTAFLAIAVFIAVMNLLRLQLLKIPHLETKPTLFFLGGLTVIFAIYWISPLRAGGFTADDWELLAAGSIRTLPLQHPDLSWYALDSVDGNFRPLGTVLYAGYLLRWFGVAPFPFLLGVFVANLLGSLVLFLIVREMGYSRLTAAAASILYISRGITYTIHAWMAALGDSLVILLCGLTTLLLLRANKRSGTAAVLYHLFAWGCFLLATLAKQSAFVMPLIVALLLVLRPGETVLPPRRQRVRNAAAGLIVYGGTAWYVYNHARALTRGDTPYPVGLTWDAVLRTFSYVTWYFTTFYLPRGTVSALATDLLGLLILLGVYLAVRRMPQLLGERPRDVLFSVLSALASVSLFMVLQTRSAPYYGSMAAFWMSVGLAILLTHLNPPTRESPPGRIACFLLFVLAVLGYAEIRLKQTAIIYSGGYIWGTLGMDTYRSEFHDLRRALETTQGAHTLVLEDFPDFHSEYPCMALLIDPAIQHILLYDSRSKSYLANDLHGARPHDDLTALGDWRAYNWTSAISGEEAAAILAADSTVRLHPGAHGIEVNR